MLEFSTMALFYISLERESERVGFLLSESNQQFWRCQKTWQEDSHGSNVFRVLEGTSIQITQCEDRTQWWWSWVWTFGLTNRIVERNERHKGECFLSSEQSLGICRSRTLKTEGSIVMQQVGLQSPRLWVGAMCLNNCTREPSRGLTHELLCHILTILARVWYGPLCLMRPLPPFLI